MTSYSQNKDKENIEKILKEALLRSYSIHESLGKSWEEMVQKNQFWEFALRWDIEAEKSIIQYLESINFPIKIISEEHWTTKIWDKQEYLWVLDGIDWSAVYKSNRWIGRYGTMFAIFSNVDPKYNDYISCWIMEHSSGNAYIATKEKWAFIHGKDSIYPIQTNPNTLFDKNTNIYIDEYWDINKETFSEKLIGYNAHCLHASSAHYMEVAEWKASFALECTRKWNLEIAVAYWLIHEAAGLMLDISWDDLWEKYYLKFWQDKHIPIITWANKEIVQALMNYIKK